MTESDLTRVRRLVELVHDLGPAQRLAVLERECGADRELLREVLELLEAAEGAPDFLERPSILPAADRFELDLEPELTRDTRIADFRLVGRIAAGGMGTVFEAEQVSPRRRVALKTLRCALLSPEAERRFRRESEILARLRHPAIAQVFAAGVHMLPDGEPLPWYALEFVEGARSLTGFVREGRLGLEQRLELFARLCEAVQHAHERGVVHRDLKPSNVLVDLSGQLKVIDFGVAFDRRTAGAGPGSFQTEVGRVLGTLQYMAPEQLSGARGGVDARADVYALGVMLYELVAGDLPYDLSNLPLSEAARVLSEHEPRRPSVVSPGLSADVDAIVLKALAKDPVRRYPSAVALADDLGRRARGEPVLARPPSATYQLSMFVRRHRAATAAVLGVVLASLGAAGVSFHYASRTRVAERLATRRFDEVRGLARSVVFELHDSIEHLAGATQARRVLVETALSYMDALEQDAGGDPGLLAEVAEGRLRLGEVLGAPGGSSLGELEAGRREIERSVAVSERLLELSPGVAASALTARSLLVLSDFEREAGRPERALELAARAEEHAERAAAWDPQAADPARLAASAGRRRAKALRMLGQTEAALALLAELAERALRTCERWPDEPEAWRDAGVDQTELGLLLLQHARAEEAAAALGLALACSERHLELAPADAQASADMASAFTWRGSARVAVGELAAALEDHRRAVELHRELLEADPLDQTAVQMLSFALSRQGMALEASRDLEGALAAHDEALALARRRLERAPLGFEERLSVAECEQAVFEPLQKLQRPDEARAALERSHAALRELEADFPGSLVVMRQLGTALLRFADEARECGRYEEALELYAEAAERLQRAVAADPAHGWTRRMVMVAHSWTGVAHKAAAEHAAGKFRRAHFSQAVDAFEAALAEESRLAEAGFLEQRDERAVALIRADLEACRGALAGVEAP